MPFWSTYWKFLPQSTGPKNALLGIHTVILKDDPSTSKTTTSIESTVLLNSGRFHRRKVNKNCSCSLCFSDPEEVHGKGQCDFCAVFYFGIDKESPTDWFAICLSSKMNSGSGATLHATESAANRVSVDTDSGQTQINYRPRTMYNDRQNDDTEDQVTARSTAY